MGFKEDTRAKFAAHSLRSFLSGAQIGAALDTNGPNAKLKWFPMLKNVAKIYGIEDWVYQHPKSAYPKFVGIPYSNVSHSSVRLMDILMEELPDEEMSFTELETLLTSNEQKVPNTNPIEFSFIIAYYISLTKSKREDFPYELAKILWGGTGSDGLVMYAVLAFLLDLSETGYIGVSNIPHLYVEDYEPWNAALDDLNDNGLNKKYFESYSHTFADNVRRLPQSHQELMLALWYSIRVSTQYKGVSYTVVPKECLSEVVLCHDSSERVLAVFCGIMTISEQNKHGGLYKIISPGNLVYKDHPYDEKITEFLSYVTAP